MKKAIIFAIGIIIGLATGTIFGVLMSRGFNTNSGSEFWGDCWADAITAAAKDKRKGFNCNSGSKFYGDEYIKAKFELEKAKING